jgi:tellurite resistance protein TehA-like permease
MAELIEKLKEAILSLFIALLGQPIKDLKHNSILVSFLTVLSITPNGSWYSFKIFIPWLLGIISISCLFILREAYRIRQSKINTNIKLGSSLEKAITISTGIPRHI